MRTAVGGVTPQSKLLFETLIKVSHELRCAEFCTLGVNPLSERDVGYASIKMVFMIIIGSNYALSLIIKIGKYKTLSANRHILHVK